MGRPRTTGCTARHHPGEPCRACTAWRAQRSRLRRRDRAASRALPPAAPDAPVSEMHVVPTPAEDERAALDAAAAAHRRLLTRAIAYVAAYRARGTILPPDACERCGIGERLTPWSKPTPLVFWHPDPAKKREVAWLCAPCRRHVRATREALTLTWTWPGGLPVRPRGRPRRSDSSATAVVIEQAWYAAAVAASAGVSSALPGLAATLFLQTVLAAAGSERVEALYRAGLRSGAAWAPLGDPARDVLLRAWIVQERARRAIADEGRVVQPLPVWERRPRRDRLPVLPPPESARCILQASDPVVQAARMARAIAKLEAGEAAVDAMLARVQHALENLRARPTVPIRESLGLGGARKP